MIRRIAILVTGWALGMLAGCAAPGLDKTSQTVDVSKESIAIFSVSMTNEFKRDYQIGTVIPNFVKSGTSSPIVMGKGEREEGREDILVSVKMPAGQYDLTKIVGTARRGLIAGMLDFSMKSTVDIPPNSVVYLGHLSLTNIERTNKDDQASGGVLPLIDQAVAGFGSGTLTVTLQDRFEKDVAQFKSSFPAMANVSILRSPLNQLTIARASGSSAAPLVIQLATAGK